MNVILNLINFINNKYENIKEFEILIYYLLL